MRPEQPSEEKQQKKQAIRAQAQQNRQALAEKDALSRQICQRLFALPEYVAAKTVLFYVDVRDEVRTQADLPFAISHGKKIVVPYCVEDQLKLFLLEDPAELVPGAYGILEPRPELRVLPNKQVTIAQIDLAVVPGVAFDRTGARMGHGFGYYDRLLTDSRRDTTLIGLAFECQLFVGIPTYLHDVFMDKLITEHAVYDCGGTRAR